MLPEIEEDEVLSDQIRVELEEVVAKLCKALNDPKRLMVLWALSTQPHSVNELSSLLSSPASNVSQHLAILRAHGLVDTERRGNSVYYHLRHPRVIEAIDILRGVLRDELSRRTNLIDGVQA